MAEFVATTTLKRATVRREKERKEEKKHERKAFRLREVDGAGWWTQGERRALGEHSGSSALAGVFCFVKKEIKRHGTHTGDFALYRRDE